MKKTIGIPPRLDCLPLKRWMRETGLFEVHEAPMAEIAMKFRKRELAAAFVSPIEYARESSEYRILPGFAVSSRAGITLFFKEGLHTIDSMAADPANLSEIVLTKIVLAEEFDTSPPIIPAIASLKTLLSKADSALLTGDAGVREKSGDKHSIDVTEIWSDMVNLPYVHGFLCAREGALTVAESNALAVNEWQEINYEPTLSDLPPDHRGGEQLDRAREYLDQCSFVLNQEVEEGLMEFLRYAHYHGIIADIPLIQLYTAEDGSLSPN